MIHVYTSSALVTLLLVIGTVALGQEGPPTVEQPVAEGQLMSFLERKITAVLTADQLEAYTGGVEPSLIELQNGETLEEFIRRQERLQRAGLVYTPLTPCVLLDTRQTGAPFSADEFRTLQVRGPGTDYSEQGGSETGCGIPGPSR